MPTRLRLLLRSILLRGRLEREMQEEMALHLERAAARLVARGLPPDEARRAARREFGNIPHLQEQARDARGARWLDSLRGDLRFALRQFARRPGTTVTMFAVLALGMSVGTMLFSFVHSYATQGPPGVELADDLVRLRGSLVAGAAERRYRAFAEAELREYQALTDHFEAVAGWSESLVALEVGTGADRRRHAASGTFVTEDYFPLFDVRPVLGPGLQAFEGDAAATTGMVVIGHTVWEWLFAGDRAVIGRTIRVNGTPMTIAGVAPERFAGDEGGGEMHVWMPLSSRRAILPGTAAEFRAAARLRDGVSVQAATAAVQSVVARLAESNEELRALDPASEVVPLLASNYYPGFDEDVRGISLAVGALALLILAVTCTNVGALQTGLAVARRQEIAVRLSLGAARGRLVRQLLTESALLAVLSGAAALGVVWVVLRVAGRWVALLPFDLAIRWQAAIFTAGLALAVGIAFGLSPALHATRLALAGALRDSAASIATTRARLQRGLVVAQIALTQPLTVVLAASLMIVLGEFQRRNLNYPGARLVAVQIEPTTVIAGEAPAASEGRRRLRDTMDRLLEHLRAAPGVEAATLDWLSGRSLGHHVVHPDDGVPGARQDPVQLVAQPSASDWFDVMGFPLVHGRHFDATDIGAAGASTGELPVIIGDDLARRMWGDGDPIGRRLRAASDTASSARTLVVVGVVDLPPPPRMQRGSDDHRIYVPADSTRTARSLLLRTRGDALPLMPTLREVVQREAPGMLTSVRTLAQIEAGHRRLANTILGGISAAGSVALLLSAIGLYAVVAFSVGQRTREIAVRLVVGARGRQIVQRFVADGLRLGVIGLVLGLPASLAGLQALTMLPEIPPVAMPPVISIATLGIVIVATLAAWIPARRAASVDPAITLRHE